MITTLMNYSAPANAHQRCALVNSWIPVLFTFGQGRSISYEFSNETSSQMAAHESLAWAPIQGSVWNMCACSRVILFARDPTCQEPHLNKGNTLLARVATRVMWRQYFDNSLTWNGNNSWQWVLIMQRTNYFISFSFWTMHAQAFVGNSKGG